jgi:3-dehydroquinate synthase II
MLLAENLVSVAQRSPTSVCVRVDEATQVKGAAFALQSGVDALLLPPQEDVWREAEVGKMERQRNDVAAGEGVSPHLELESARVTSVVQGGVGDRVCIDLISNLGDGEGMLLGSSAKLLSLVHAETLSTGFVPARPFRVNAGPVHSYVMMADLSTKYLSEIRAGDEVLVISPAQPPRSVMVGRSKVEPRPMLMVSFELTRTGGAGALAGNIFLQQAETVRLIGPASEDANGAANVATSVTALKEGDEIYVRAVSEGTHIGRRIDSEVREL